MSKSIVIMADGTGQEGGKGHNTNIYRMFDMMENRTPDQVVFYDAGVGTGWRKISGNVSGNGVSRNIRQGYEFLFENYQVGDKIFLLGFSRGAATVRSLSAFISLFGILPRSRASLIREAFGIYRKRLSSNFTERVDEFIRGNGTTHARIEFLGCYDTVAALAFPIKTVAKVMDRAGLFKWRFHNFDLSANVSAAYQAIAIDDERKTFHPALWNHPPPENSQILEQVWFVGMHSDVGGGYHTGRDLSSIPLVWMIDRAVDHGLRIKTSIEPIYEDATDVMHNSRGSLWSKIYRKRQRDWDSTRSDHPVVHESVSNRGAAGPVPVERTRTETVEVNYDPWILRLPRLQTETWEHVEALDWYEPETVPWE